MSPEWACKEVVMDYEKFIKEQIAHIKQTVGGAKAINALSGGVDSSVVTILGHRALGDRLKTPATVEYI